MEFGFANVLLALALIPLVPTLGSADVAVRTIAIVALAYFSVNAIILLRRWRALSLTGFPGAVIAFDLLLTALLIAAVLIGTIAAWEWALLGLLARQMLAFLLVLATLRPETD